MTGTDLSFDPRRPYLSLGSDGLSWSAEIFTLDNVYGLDPESLQSTERDESTTVECRRLALAGNQQTVEGWFSAQLKQSGADTIVSVRAHAPEPIKAVKFLLRGLPQHGWWSPTTPIGADHQDQPQLWEYPSMTWATPWAAVSTDSKHVVVSFRDGVVRPKRFYAHQPPYLEEPVCELIYEVGARDRDRECAVPELRITVCEEMDSVLRTFDGHLEFLEHAYGLRRFEDRPDVPRWLSDIQLVVTLHGQHWTGYVFNTFSRMEDTLRLVTDHIDGRHVLAYLPGWEGRYYRRYPNYVPGEDLGGAAGFRSLIRTAKDLGVRIMPMFGAYGAHINEYQDWRAAVFHNSAAPYVELLNSPDWDGDRKGEGAQVFLNPGEPGFRAHLRDQILAVVEGYEADAVFLDTSAWFFNDPRHDLMAGFRTLVQEIREGHEELLIAGEGWWDALLGLFPVNQQWLGSSRRFRLPHLLTRYGRTFRHLAEGAPGLGSSGVHEAGFRAPEPFETIAGHIPSISFVDDTLERHRDTIIALCRQVADA